MTHNTKNIVVLGSGAWGSALAKHCHRMGHNTTLWCRRQILADTINTQHVNTQNLDTIDLNGITATSDISCCNTADMILVVIPSQHIRENLQNVTVRDNTPVLICSKGVELDTLQLMSDVAQECLPNANIMILSGPTFAIEVAKKLPTAVTLAGKNAQDFAPLLSSPHFRLYTTDDVVGAEISGAIKNVIAIACGIAHAQQLGDNAKSALITRALAEISRLSLAIGGKPETLMGLCGVADLVLTCSSVQSRNMSFGVELGRGKSVQDILNSRSTITEGVLNSKSIIKLAEKHAVSMPICQAVYDIIHNNKDVQTAIHTLLNRPQS